MADGHRLALFCRPGPAAETLLERLADNPSISSLVPIGTECDDESLLWRGRPVFVKPSSVFAADDFSVAIFLDDAELAAAHINDCVDGALTVLDGTGVLDQQGEGCWYWGGDALPADARLISVADAVVSHIVAVVEAFSEQPRALSLAVCLPVSHRGKAGIDALAAESARLLNGQGIEHYGLEQQIAFNVLPDLDGQLAASYEHQLRAILGSDVVVQCHCFTVPVFFGHSISVTADTAYSIDHASLLGSLTNNSRVSFNESASAAALTDDPGIEIASLSLDRQSDTRVRATLIGDNLRDGVVSNLVSALEILIKSDT